MEYYLLGKIYEDDILKTFCDRLLSNEAKSWEEAGDPTGIYGNSIGVENGGWHWACLHNLTSTISQITGRKVKAVNPYCRIYRNGAKLNKHIDRETLDWTLTVCLGHNLDDDWPFYFNVNGEVIKFSNEIGHAALIKGRTTEHWRDPLNCAAWQYSIHMFLHWQNID
jgi:hypothetical protein